MFFRLGPKELPSFTTAGTSPRMRSFASAPSFVEGVVVCRNRYHLIRRGKLKRHCSCENLRAANGLRERGQGPIGLGLVGCVILAGGNEPPASTRRPSMLDVASRSISIDDPTHKTVNGHLGPPNKIIDVEPSIQQAGLHRRLEGTGCERRGTYRTAHEQARALGGVAVREILPPPPKSKRTLPPLVHVV